MEYLQPSFSIRGPGYKATACCEACVYGRGSHAEWCEKSKESEPEEQDRK